MRGKGNPPPKLQKKTNKTNKPQHQKQTTKKKRGCYHWLQSHKVRAPNFPVKWEIAMLEELLWSNNLRVSFEDSSSGGGWSFLCFTIFSLLFEENKKYKTQKSLPSCFCPFQSCSVKILAQLAHLISKPKPGLEKTVCRQDISS